MSWYDPRTWSGEDIGNAVTLGNYDRIKDSNFLWGDPKVEMDPEKAKLQGGEYIRDIAAGGVRDVQGRQAPQAEGVRVGDPAQAGAAQVNQAQQAEWRQRQLALANQLQGVSTGAQRGAGEMAANRAAQQAIASQQAMARMGRGGNAALAARGAARNTADITGQMAGQAQQAAMQDQASARAQLGGLVQGARGQDIGMATTQAGLQQQVNLANMSAQNQQIFQQAGLDQATSLANMQAKLATMGMNDQATIAYLAAIYGVDVAEMQARLEQDKMQIAQRGEGVGADIMVAAGTAAAGAI